MTADLLLRGRTVAGTTPSCFRFT